MWCQLYAVFVWSVGGGGERYGQLLKEGVNTITAQTNIVLCIKRWIIWVRYYIPVTGRLFENRSAGTRRGVKGVWAFQTDLALKFLLDWAFVFPFVSLVLIAGCFWDFLSLVHTTVKKVKLKQPVWLLVVDTPRGMIRNLDKATISTSCIFSTFNWNLT